MLCSQDLPVRAGQGEHRAVRAIHQHGIGFGGALLAQRIAVVPDRAGVGSRFGCGNCSHTSTLRTGERAPFPRTRALLPGRLASMSARRV